VTDAKAEMILHDIAKYGVVIHQRSVSDRPCLTIMSTTWARHGSDGSPKYGDPTGKSILYAFTPEELREAIQRGLGAQQVPLWRYEQPTLPYLE